MSTRPVSISVIGWALIILGALGGVSMLFTTFLLNNSLMYQMLARNHAPVPVQLGVVFATVVMMIVCGIALMWRQNWARYVYVVWMILRYIYVFTVVVTSSLLMIPNIILFVVICFFLFTPTANRYFSGKDGDEDSPPVGE